MDLPDNFIQRYLLYTEGQESPVNFHQWVGTTIVGAAAGRSVWLDQAFYKVHPNFFTILTAGSALCRKGVALEIGVDILRDAIDELEDRVILSEKVTPEALLQVLGKTMTTGEGAEQYRYSRPTLLYSDELGVFLSQAAQHGGMVDILMRLYTCPRYFEYVTKTQGVSIIRNSCFNILGATTPTWISRNMTPSIFGEGFVGRTLFVFSETPKQRIARPVITDRERVLRKLLVDQLKGITTRAGEFHFTSAGGKFYDEWYEERKANNHEEKNSGFFGREHIHVLKTAMCYALSAGVDELLLDVNHIEAAIYAVREVRESMPHALAGADFDDTQRDVARVYAYLRKRKTPATREQILRGVWRHMGTTRLEEAINTLVDSNRVHVEHVGTKNKAIYLLEDIGDIMS